MRPIAILSFIVMTATTLPAENKPLTIYEFKTQPDARWYDEAMAVASLQGIINREQPRLYLRSQARDLKPSYWLGKFTQKGQWLHGREIQVLADLDALVDLAGTTLKGAVIWDPQVPATINIATTIAGVRDAIVLSPELAQEHLDDWKLPVIEDLRNRFDGSHTGSAKNDAYRWAIREYLAAGKCSSHLLCLFEDAAYTRVKGDTSYVVTRDWAVANRAFVYDLSPWGDEAPADDPQQPLGADLETYRLMLQTVAEQAGGQHMTEVTGFFSFIKYSNVPGHVSKHDPVPTEWETVYQISPYNAYQNTVSSNCFNQSLHHHAPFKPLKQPRPERGATLENKLYICILMADYDSATTIYEFIPKSWDDPTRGQLPLAWGLNPNLIETYPDIITYLYQTATPNDIFTSDASAAGYMNPSRIKPEHLPLFVKHNQKFFTLTDMSIAPMVLDWVEASPAVKDAFTQFSPDGYATILIDFHQSKSLVPQQHVWKGMSVMELLNHACNFESPDQTANAMSTAIADRGIQPPGFALFRITWTPPAPIIASINAFKQQHPDWEIEVVDPYNFFALFKKHYEQTH